MVDIVRAIQICDGRKKIKTKKIPNQIKALTFGSIQRSDINMCVCVSLMGRAKKKFALIFIAYANQLFGIGWGLSDA